MSQPTTEVLQDFLPATLKEEVDHKAAVFVDPSEPSPADETAENIELSEQNVQLKP